MPGEILIIFTSIRNTMHKMKNMEANAHSTFIILDVLYTDFHVSDPNVYGLTISSVPNLTRLLDSTYKSIRGIYSQSFPSPVGANLGL